VSRLDPRRFRGLSALVAALAALGLVLLPPPDGGTARAADGDDSAVTVRGRPGGHDDFSGLSVTVHQTRGLRDQGVRVTWTGGAPTEGNFARDYLQLMQCWGDDPDGPTREQCDYGFGLPVQGQTTTRVVGLSGDGATTDPAETEYPHSGGASGWVPFVPANGAAPTTDPYATDYFTPQDSNAQPYARTNAAGRGETVFEIQAGVTASHLGCGTAPSAGAGPRSCWLVIVPRGEHEVSGQRMDATPLRSSPLSTTNWAQRLVVPLEFAPIGDYCDLGGEERHTVGSELAQEAMTAWQPALCPATGAVFGTNWDNDEFARSQVLNPVEGGAGLGFVSAPAVPAEGSPPVAHAPVAISGLAIASFIEDAEGEVVRDLRLNPRLIAKLLTATYQNDVPDGRNQPHLEGNPGSLTCDPEFQELNPRFSVWATQCHRAPSGLIVPDDDGDAFRQLWAWLQSDPDARAFLAGRPDEWGARVNPFYRELNLDETIPGGFPKAEPSLARPGTYAPEDVFYSQMDLRPYVGSMHAGAIAARRGDAGGAFWWDPSRQPPGMAQADPDRVGQRYQLAVVDVATARSYHLPAARLPNADGTWTSPDEDALLAAVEAMEPTAADPDVLALDPADAGDGAYPLTSVVYAAASTGLDEEARTDYAALIRYAAGDGQEPGIGNGLLPPGYAPLPEELRARAGEAADQLIAGVPAGGTDSGGTGGDLGADAGGTGGPSSGAGGRGGDVGGTGGGDPGAAGGGDPGGTAGDTGGTGDPADAGGDGDPGGGEGPPAEEEDRGPADDNVAQTGALTPETLLGIVRWVLFGVLAAALAAAIAGPILLRHGMPRANRTTPLPEGNSLTN
jgi:hypothetical protein